jgi:hypothetical protein
MLGTNCICIYRCQIKIPSYRFLSLWCVNRYRVDSTNCHCLIDYISIKFLVDNNCIFNLKLLFSTKELVFSFSVSFCDQIQLVLFSVSPDSGGRVGRCLRQVDPICRVLRKNARGFGTIHEELEGRISL